MTAVAEEVEAITLDKKAADGSLRGRVALDPSWFGVQPNVPLIHQVVVSQRAARRAGTQSTKTRAEVAGGGAKPYRQKGTGRARQGSTRSPQFEGGGVALGPKPRSYKQRTPRKMVQLALRGALSDRFMQRRVCLVDEWGWNFPKTKSAVAAVDALGLDGRILVVISSEDVIAERSFDNLPYVDVIEAAQLTAYHVMCSDWVVFTDSTLPGETTLLEEFDADSDDGDDTADDANVASHETAGATAHGAVTSTASASDSEVGDAADEVAISTDAEGVGAAAPAAGVNDEAVSSASESRRADGAAEVDDEEVEQ
jgi:large subunit ribosomal protein L4